jgi:acyl-CoA thioesterase-1
VLVLGDSISAAYGMSLEQGWVALLEGRLQEDYPGLRAVNASISGDTSAGGLRRLPQLIEAHSPDLLILELGGNDGLRGYPTAQLEENLRTMVAMATATGSRVLLLQMEIPPNYGPRYTQAFRETFISAAQTDGASLGPFLMKEVATNTNLMQRDGIHPTVEAQPILLETLLPSVRAELTALDVTP